MRYIYGPIRSRRIGLSLGVNLTPLKICSFNCVYCQLGPTTITTMERTAYLPIQEVLEELKTWFEQNSQQVSELRYVTLSGFGEPTLHSELSFFIDELKKITSVPVAVITNSSTLAISAVREALKKVDLVIPSLDAATEAIFEKIDSPHPSIKIEQVVEGLVTFRREFFGKIWLEVMLVKGINDSLRHIKQLKEAIERINPDKIQLNSPVRKTAQENILPVPQKKLQKIKAMLGDKCEII